MAKPGDGQPVSHVGFDAHVRVPGEVTGGALSIVEFSIDPRRLVPPHTHASEEELSYVLDGEVGFRVGDDEITAGPGSYVYKPKGIMHTFWNATDLPVRILEIIFPAGLEESFRERVNEPDSANARAADTEAAAKIGARASRQPNVHSDEWVPELKERYGLRLLGES